MLNCLLTVDQHGQICGHFPEIKVINGMMELLICVFSGDLVQLRMSYTSSTSFTGDYIINKLQVHGIASSRLHGLNCSKL